MADHIDDEDVIAEAIAEAMGQLHTILPATLTAYDHATQRASIAFDLRTLWVDAETDAEKWIQPAGVTDVPVIAHPALVADIGVGTRGLALIAERDIETWKASGGVGVQPTDARKFDRNGAIFLPGVYPGGSNPDARAGATVLPSTDIRLGNPDATAPVAREPETAAAFLAIQRRVARVEAIVDAITTAVEIPLKAALAANPATAALANLRLEEIIDALASPQVEAEQAPTDIGALTTKVE